MLVFKKLQKLKKKTMRTLKNIDKHRFIVYIFHDFRIQILVVDYTLNDYHLAIHPQILYQNFFF